VFEYLSYKYTLVYIWYIIWISVDFIKPFLTNRKPIYKQKKYSIFLSQNNCGCKNLWKTLT